MNDPGPATLSPAGEARREAILEELIGHMQRTRRRRERRRRLGAAAALVLLGCSALWLGVRREAAERPTGEDAPAAFTAHRPRVILWTGRTGLVREVGDEDLLELLASIGLPAGLVRTEGRTWLVAPDGGPVPLVAGP